MPRATARFARRFRYLLLLRASLVVGALYNLLGAAFLVAAPATLLDPLGAVPEAPGERVLLALLALAAALLASLYAFAARDPRRYSAIIAVAIAGRLGGGGVLAAAALLAPSLAGLTLPAAAELALGLAHAAFWRPVYA